MTTFDDRKDTAEKKFAHDAELKFKIVARRNKLLGLWAADLMGISGAAAENYAKEVVVSDFDEPGDEDVFRKVFDDFKANNINKSEHQVRRQMEELLETARDQVTSE